MTRKVRDDFLKSTIRQLAENSSYFCNNPLCRNTTISSSSYLEKPSKIGVAAHICAASPGGPRYDSSQTPEERSNYNNGIWLCTNCSVLIDRDVEEYTVERLKSWKDQHQKWLHENNNFLPFEELKSRLHESSLIRIEQNKRIHKYIPEIYTEFADIKEIGRFFSDPCKFWNKLIDLLEITDFSNLCEFLNEFKIYNFEFNLPSELKRNIPLSELYFTSQTLDNFLELKIKEIKEIQELLLDLNTIQSIPLDLRYKFNHMKYKFWTLINYTDKLEKLKRLNNAIKSRIFVVTSSAAKGKTNFLCDISENFLLRCKIPFFFVNASELDELNEISSCFLDLVYRGSNCTDLHSFGTSYQLDFENRSAVFVILIDGLNEVVNIDSFRRKLISFIEFSLKYDFIKLILTCRDEYFEQLFCNFEMLPRDSIFIEKDFSQKIRENNQNELWDKYLEHFDVTIRKCNIKVYDKLTKNPLLLRIFCEVNKGKTIDSLNDLYTTDLFKEYFDRIIGNISASKSADMNLYVNKNAIIIKVFKTLVEFIILNRKYLNIKVEDLNFNEFEIKELNKIINEDILLKKELESNDILSTSNEVISFTFDEFRDFLISNQLVYNLYENNRDLFEEFLDEAITNDYTIFEGVSKYLFYLCKKEGNELILQKLELQPWFDSIFVREIFNIEEKYILSEEISRLKLIFLEGRPYHDKLLINLSNRLDMKKDKVLNVSILFEILKSISEEQYESLIISHFTLDNSESRSKINLDGYFGALEEDLREYSINNDINHNKFKLLIVFMGGCGPITEKACHLFSMYSKQYPERSKNIIEEFKEIGISNIKKNVNIEPTQYQLDDIDFDITDKCDY